MCERSAISIKLSAIGRKEAASRRQNFAISDWRSANRDDESRRDLRGRRRQMANERYLMTVPQPRTTSTRPLGSFLKASQVWLQTTMREGICALS